MSIALLRFILMLSFANPMAVVLSHKMVVGGCGYPKSARIVRRPAACGVLAAGKECSVLGFACGCYDARDNCSDSGYGAVDARRLVFVAQKKDTADDRASV